MSIFSHTKAEFLLGVSNLEPIAIQLFLEAIATVGLVWGNIDMTILCKMDLKTPYNKDCYDISGEYSKDNLLKRNSLEGCITRIALNINMRAPQARLEIKVK